MVVAITVFVDDFKLRTTEKLLIWWSREVISLVHYLIIFMKSSSRLFFLLTFNFIGVFLLNLLGKIFPAHNIHFFLHILIIF